MARKDQAVVRVAGLRYWRSTEAAVAVEAWKRSGEGLRAFAERYGIHPRRLGRWSRELGEAAEEPVRFHRVRIVQTREVEHPGDGSLEIVLGEGWRVRVPPGFAAEDLDRVIEVLGARC